MNILAYKQKELFKSDQLKDLEVWRLSCVLCDYLGGPNVIHKGPYEREEGGQS